MRGIKLIGIEHEPLKIQHEATMMAMELRHDPFKLSSQKEFLKKISSPTFRDSSISDYLLKRSIRVMKDAIRLAEDNHVDLQLRFDAIHHLREVNYARKIRKIGLRGMIAGAVHIWGLEDKLPEFFFEKTNCSSYSEKYISSISSRQLAAYKKWLEAKPGRFKKRDEKTAYS